MLFAEITNAKGRVHIGCLMAAGADWVEVSIPEASTLPDVMFVRFLPAETVHRVVASWRLRDRVGFTYTTGGPPFDHFAGYSGLMDPLTADQKRRLVLRNDPV